MRMLLLLGLFAAGCGGSGTETSTATGSCDTPSSQVHTCLDYSGPADVLTSYKSTCTSENGTWTDGASCSHTGAVGGCRSMDAGVKLTYTTWFYGPNIDASTVQQACNGVFVTP